MLVKVVKRFGDLKEDKPREVNDEFEVTKSRYEEIKTHVVKVKKAPNKKKGD